jgi:plastocyanin
VIRGAADHDEGGMRHALLAALLGATILAGCGSGDAADQNSTAMAAAAAPTTTIRIKDFVFDPTPATIKAGQTISVSNEDAAPHTLTDKPAAGGKALFDTGTVNGRRTGSFTAGTPGTYQVYCVIHPFMKGEVKVVS